MAEVLTLRKYSPHCFGLAGPRDLGPVLCDQRLLSSLVGTGTRQLVRSEMASSAPPNAALACPQGPSHRLWVRGPGTILCSQTPPSHTVTMSPCTPAVLPPLPHTSLLQAQTALPTQEPQTYFLLLSPYGPLVPSTDLDTICAPTVLCETIPDHWLEHSPKDSTLSGCLWAGYLVGSFGLAVSG
jgi:hypothetical protein